MASGEFDEFIYLVISAFAHQNYKGEPVNADINGDNKISAQEAFGYAVAHDQQSESPVLEAAENSGQSALMGLNFN